MRKILAIASTLFALSAFAALTDYKMPAFNSYILNGKYGILYYSEVAHYPIFDELRNVRIIDHVSGDSYRPRYMSAPCLFAYRSGEKWGLVCNSVIVTEPIYDDIVPMGDDDYIVGDHYLIKFKQNGKWGILGFDGNVIIPAQFDEIILSSKGQLLGSFNYVDYNKKEHSQHVYKIYILTRNGKKHSIYDLTGQCIVDDFKGFSDKISKYSALLKWSKWNKSIKKTEQKLRPVEKSEFFRNFTDYEKEEADRFNGLKYWWPKLTAKLKSDISRAKIISENGKFGIKFDNTIVLPCMFDSITDFDENGIATATDGNSVLNVNIYGFIIYKKAAKGAFENKCIEFNRLFVDNNSYAKAHDGFVDLLDWLDAQPYQRPEIHDYLEGKIFETKYHIDKIAEKERSERRWATIGNIMGALNTTTQNIARFVKPSSQTADASSSPANNNGSSSGSNKMGLADAKNYQTMRDTYNKWAYDLMQMKNANGRYQNGYTQQDKQHAQSEMKRLRQMAKQKWGKDIPYNSIEDWK